MHGLLFKEVEDEVSSFLSGLINKNTTNPPGNEIVAAKYVSESLKQDGFKCELFESSAGRGNVVTRLRGSSGKPSLLLLSHLDVVAADPKEWSVDPFSGVIKDGFVWGRGALDMKGMTAIEVMALKLLKRSGVKLKGDVILAATADEEKGGEAGAGWLVQNHPDKIQADYVLNEGGGLSMDIDGKHMFTINTAEKGILWLKIKAGGTPGHGSIPGAADNAILRMNRVVEKLGSYRPEPSLVTTVKQLLTSLTKSSKFRDLSILLRDLSKSDQVLDTLAQKDKHLAEELRACLRMTATPTIIRGGVKENIIPSECEAVFDCRILPGQSINETIDLIKTLLNKVGLDKLSFEFIQAHDGSESTINSPLYRVINDVLKEFEPTCGVTPTLTTGGTDSRFFRETGSVCYGFQPMIPDEPNDQLEKRMHGIDERITIENLVYGTSILYETVKRFMS